ncbi:hypothetical protein NAEGRDRAFT_77904 [Naegleria gruberi]|uniref:Uncharacterized protein n=1 Tax=Naegleria gruberi TaxID=5762 RepID=D2UZB6_NAEGR|nr:uncharacterized protein NAEGRDRAFT_77904 [Naegleria gruberi]EFC49919.1 hypothetical protein NAEGRDRAFT_77904 [Naegleria gruberi]|eukprot:XP_002682663.1 hypothetical protein NAEGRDRAFT_77904 [Naegleria gruberi strain NEG-M]
MLTVFIMNYKKMVYNKKLLYLVVLLVLALQECFQLSVVSTTLSILFNSGVIFPCISFSSELSLFFLTIVMYTNCQSVITKILYELYFNKAHEWMRMNANNQKAALGVKWSSISILAILNLTFILLVPFLFALVFFIFDSEKKLTISEHAFKIVSAVSNVFLVTFLVSTCIATFFFTFLNMVIVVLLIRKLILNQRFPVTEQRRKGCRNLLILSFGQLYVALLNVLVLILAFLGVVVYFPLFHVSLIIQKVAMLCFCVVVTFSFGPLDHIILEFRNSSQQVANVEIIQKRDEISQQVASNYSEIVRKEEFREEESTPTTNSEIPIMVDAVEIFTEIPLD